MNVIEVLLFIPALIVSVSLGLALSHVFFGKILGRC